MPDPDRAQPLPPRAAADQATATNGWLPSVTHRARSRGRGERAREWAGLTTPSAYESSLFGTVTVACAWVVLPLSSAAS